MLVFFFISKRAKNDQYPKPKAWKLEVSVFLLLSAFFHALPNRTVSSLPKDTTDALHKASWSLDYSTASAS